jgi:hypothetical protein
MRKMKQTNKQTKNIVTKNADIDDTFISSLLINVLIYSLYQ